MGETGCVILEVSYKNEADCITICEGITIRNRVDRVSIAELDTVAEEREIGVKCNSA
jgi:hypothetical protein